MTRVSIYCPALTSLPRHVLCSSTLLNFLALSNWKEWHDEKSGCKILDQRLHEHPPAYGTTGSAGIDLRACIEHNMIIAPGQCDANPQRHRHAYRRPALRRDDPATLGLGHKHGIVLGNLVGLIDSDYQGRFSCRYGTATQRFYPDAAGKNGTTGDRAGDADGINIVDEFRSASAVPAGSAVR